MSKRKRLEKIEQAVAERVAELNSELDKDPAEPERRRQRRARQAAAERARRVERAQQKLAELVQEQAERARTHAKEEAEKGDPKVSVSDPEARAMRLADGAVAPAWNVQSLPRRRPGWPPATASSSASIRPIGARPADWRREWSRRSPSAVAGRRGGGWPIPRR
jgi:hypothetical protein